MDMIKKIIKYGLISTAQIGLNAHIPAARESKNSSIVSISSRESKKAEEAAKKYNIERWYSSYSEQINDPDIDAVINPLPNSMHSEWTIKSAEAGKHILCEKPLSTTVEECKKMIDAAKANNVLLVEAFTHRWNPHLRKAKELISKGTIGKISTIDSSLSFSAADTVYQKMDILGRPQSNIRFLRDLDGGSLWDAGCYAVYATRFVMGEEPVLVSGLSYDSGDWGIDTTFSGIMKFKDGAIANIISSMEQPFRSYISIRGSKGRIDIPEMFNDSGPIIIEMGDGRSGRDEKIISTIAPYRFTVQINEFSECILANKIPEFPPEDGLLNTKVIQALYESVKLGKIIEI